MKFSRILFNNFSIIRFSLVLYILLILIGIVSCTPGEPTPQDVRVEVKRAREGGFHVKWKTGDVRKALVFARGSFRSELWRPSRSGAIKYKIHRVADKEMIEASAPTQEFEVFVPEMATDVAGDYSFLTRFTDGAVLLFSGYLDVTPIRCAHNCSAEEVLGRPNAVAQSVFTLSSNTGENIIVDQELVGRSGEFTYESDTQGGFIYFGKQRILSGRGYRIVPDRNIPKWVLDELMEVMPKLIELHTERFGRSLDFQPLIFLPHLTEFRSYHTSHSGAVLGKQMILSLFGDRWFSGRTEERSDFRVLMAHEAFHLWNASLFKTTAEAGGHWLHEGSADAFAFLSLLELGLIGREELSALKDESLNRCLFGISNLDSANSGSAYQLRNQYTCGAVVQNLLNASLQQVGSDLWTLWGRLFDHAAERGGIYSKNAFFSLALKETENDLVMTFANELLEGKLNDLSGIDSLQRSFMEAHQAAGERLIYRDGDWPEWYRKMLGEQAIASSLLSDCGPGARMTISLADRSLSGFDYDRIRLTSLPQCQYLKADVDVTDVGGFGIFSDGVRVYDLIHRKCGNQSSPAEDHVQLSNRDGGLVQLKCPQLPQRPQYAHIPF